MGISSRRQSEKMMVEGRIILNSKIVTELGTKMDPETDHLKVDGKPVRIKENRIYMVLNKPKGYLTTSFDDRSRPTIYDLINKKIKMWLFTVGRLDYNSEGLLLLTNDGQMSRYLTLPQNNIERIYEAKLQGVIKKEELKKINDGIMLEDGWISKPKVRFSKKTKENCWVEVILKSGKNREVRRIFERVGYNILKLRRISFGPIKLGDIKPGELRHLTPLEINKLNLLCSNKTVEIRNRK